MLQVAVPLVALLLLRYPLDGLPMVDIFVLSVVCLSIVLTLTTVDVGLRVLLVLSPLLNIRLQVELEDGPGEALKHIIEVEVA